MQDDIVFTELAMWVENEGVDYSFEPRPRNTIEAAYQSAKKLLLDGDLNIKTPEEFIEVVDKLAKENG